MEHKLIQGGEQYLPFARSRIKALRALGLSHASQQFEIDGVSVKVRTDGEHDYIRLEESGHLMWVVLNATIAGTTTSGSYVDGGGNTHTTTTIESTFRSYLFKLKMAKKSALELSPVLVHTGSTSKAETTDSHSAGGGNNSVLSTSYSTDAEASCGITNIIPVGKSVCGVCLYAGGTNSFTYQDGSLDAYDIYDRKYLFEGDLKSRLILGPSGSGSGARGVTTAITQTASEYGYTKKRIEFYDVFGGTLNGLAFSEFRGGVNGNAYFWTGDPHIAAGYSGFATPGARPGAGWDNLTPLTLQEFRGGDGVLTSSTDWAPSPSLPNGFSTVPVVPGESYSPMESAYSWIQGSTWFSDSARTANAPFRIYNRDGSILDTHIYYGQNGEIYAYLSKHKNSKKFLSLENVNSTTLRPIAANGTLSQFDIGSDLDITTWPGIKDDTAFKAMITAGTYYKQIVPALMTS